MTDDLPTSAAEPYDYWAFISYSSKDRRFAKWLHAALESYRLPVRFLDHLTPIGEPAPKRMKPLFWDRAEMTADHDLGALIKRNLRASRYLIVICSPHAAQSLWVETEVQTFVEFHGQERVLSVIVSGNPGAKDDTNCFPPMLRSREPKAPDARKEGDGRTRAKLMLLATMLGLRFDDLYQRELRRQRTRLLWFALSSILAISVVASLWGKARNEMIRADAAQSLRLRGEYLAEIRTAKRLWDEDDEAGLTALLNKYNRAFTVDPRSLEWNYWSHLVNQRSPESITVPGAAWRSVSVHPGEARFAAIDAKEHVSVWDINTRKELFRHEVIVKSIEFTRDGKYLVSLSPALFDLNTARMGSETIRIWDAFDGHSVGEFAAPPSTLSVAVHPDGNQIAMGDHGGRVYVAAFPSGDDRQMLNSTINGPTGMSLDDVHGAVTDLVWRDNGYFFASGHEDGSIIIWSTEANIQTGKCSHSSLIKGHVGPVTGIAFSPDARTVVSQSCGIFDDLGNQLLDGTAIAWTAASGKAMRQWSPHGAIAFIKEPENSYSLSSPGKMLEGLAHTQGRFRPAFTANGREVLTTGERSVQRWDTLSGTRLGELHRCNTPVSVVATNPRAGITLSATGDNILISRYARHSAHEICASERLIFNITLSPDGQTIAAVVESKEGRGLSYEGGDVIYTRSLDHDLQVWNTSDGQEILTSSQLSAGIVAPWFSPDGRSVGLGLEATDLHTTRPIPFPGLDTESVSTSEARLFPSDNGKLALRVAAVDRQKGWQVDLISFPNGDTHRLLAVTQELPMLAEISHDLQFAVLSLEGGVVEIWSLNQKSRQTSIQTNVGVITALAISPNGQLLATGGTSRQVQIWDLKTQTLLLTLNGHRREISDLVYTPDSALLISSSGIALKEGQEPGEVRIWDLLDGELRSELPSDRHEIYPSIALSRDGDRLYAAACDNRTQPTEVLQLFSPGGQRFLPTAMPEANAAGRIIFWDISPISHGR